MCFCTVTVLPNLNLESRTLQPTIFDMSPPRANSTASTRGTIYQLCSAVHACFELAPGDRLLIEEFGDLTVPGEYQTEIKNYSDSLTDGHTNLWNTLYNWCLGGTDVSSFRKLVLATTQPFGARARIAEWNTLSNVLRIDLLAKLHDESELRFAAGLPGKKPPTVLVQQRELLATVNHTRLEQVVAKVVIDAQQPVMSTLVSELADRWFRAVDKSHRLTALKGLVGFICRPDMRAGTSWEVGYEEFNKEYADLVRRYTGETREFPRAAFARQSAVIHPVSAVTDPFIRKIHHIGHHRRVSTAIRDYYSVIETIDQEFREYTGSYGRLLAFRSTVTERFELGYENACMVSIDDAAARQFYNTTMSSAPPSFAGYVDSPDWFRNGLLHTLMNDDGQLYQWKLVEL